ncbi:MAG: hypothetical protein KGH98_04770, partial [Candidatus Micrarchaeota archaeon]|nr:hypothetical protein [Candidatus Micrarchaeota archaeon]
MLISFIGAFTTVGATYVNVIEPFNTTVQQNGTIALGSAGPGQTFFVTVSAETKNANGTSYPLGWNKLVAYDLPEGWVAENSSLNIQRLSVKITPNANASNGTYSFRIRTINNANLSGLGNLTFSAYVNITPNVFRLGATPQVITSGIGEPADIYVTI